MESFYIVRLPTGAIDYECVSLESTPLPALGVPLENHPIFHNGTIIIAYVLENDDFFEILNLMEDLDRMADLTSNDIHSFHRKICKGLKVLADGIPALTIPAAE